MAFCRNLWQKEQHQDLIENKPLTAFIALPSAASFLDPGQSITSLIGGEQPTRHCQHFAI